MKITAEKLKKWEACEACISVFNRIFPNGAEFNLENVEKYVKEGGMPSNLNFVAQHIFNKKYLKKYYDIIYKKENVMIDKDYWIKKAHKRYNAIAKLLKEKKKGEKNVRRTKS